MPDQWPRALLRAELLEAGYDTVGARTLEEAATLLGHDEERGPVGLVLVEERALRGQESALSKVARIPSVALTVLLTRGAGSPDPAGAWSRVLRRPLSLGAIVAEVRSLLPLPHGHEPTSELPP
jgi:hypothetical protein